VGVHATYDVDRGIGQESNHDERMEGANWGFFYVVVLEIF
jgi:hypothetical protein